ncbi:MAG: hypothetical protein OXH93_18330 [Caldilineaceae bacterium]|nr:hypothetical protein [Caldilineaceae bacterium]
MPHQLLHLLRAVDLAVVERRLQVVQLVGIGLLRQDRSAVLVGEGRLDCVEVVGEIKHERVVLPRVRPVETGKRLHRLDARQRLVHVHRVQQRLIVTGLKLACADQEAIGISLNALSCARSTQYSRS